MTSEELSQCLDSCGDNVYGFCLYLTGNRVKADDLYQDTFLTALEKADRISVDDNPGSYLMGIALRLWKNHERKNARRMRIAGSESLEERQERKGTAETMFDMALEIIHQKLNEVFGTGRASPFAPIKRMRVSFDTRILFVS